MRGAASPYLDKRKNLRFLVVLAVLEINITVSLAC